MSRYRNIRVKIDPDAIPEYWLARQKELAELAAVDGEQAPVGAVGSITREQDEEMLGGAPATVPAGAEDESS